MRYIALEEVELSKEDNKFINALSQCMLSLLNRRLFVEDNSNLDIEDEEFDINYDFSMYGKEIMEMREKNGCSNSKLIEIADNFVRKLQ